MAGLTPLKAIRKNCLQCTGGSAKCVAYCPCDGELSTRCHLWPYRFGIRPQNVTPPDFVAAGTLPGPDVPLEELPAPRITCESGRKLTPQQRTQIGQRLNQARKKIVAERDLVQAGPA